MTTQEFLGLYPNWSLTTVNDCQALTCEYQFANFTKAFSFMTRVAIIAEQLNHHPNWSNVYNKVNIVLYTHQKNAITQLDVQFALKVESKIKPM